MHQQDESYLINFINLKSADLYYRGIHNCVPIEDSANSEIVSYLYHPQAFNNAFYDSETRNVYFGDMDQDIFFPFINNLEITTHELGHAITDSTSGLEYYGESGALNESMSDIFAIMHKQFESKNYSAASSDVSWLIGEGVIKSPDGGPNQSLRSMSQPGTAYNHPRLGGQDPQPSHMNGLHSTTDISFENDNGGVHINSGIPNHAFYRAAIRDQGPSWARIGKV